MGTPLKQKARGRRKPRAESKKMYDVQQQYADLSPLVNLKSCWWCDYFRARVADDRRQHLICGFTGEAVRPESACHVGQEVVAC
jgi:hypothetical protein